MRNINKTIVSNIFDSQIKDSKSGRTINIIKPKTENKSDNKSSDNK